MKKILLVLLVALLACMIAVLSACDTSVTQPPLDTDATDTSADTSADTTETVDDRDITILSVYDITKGAEHARAEHVADPQSSVIELDRRSVEKLVSKDTGSSKTYYPRVKVLSDGTYMLFYQDGRWGPNVYYMTSDDYQNWSKPTLLFGSCEIGGDTKKFCTADAVVMPDGEIIVVCTFISLNNYTTHNTYNGMALKRSSDNGKTWSDMEIIYGATAWEPDILLRADGELQIYFTHTGPYLELYGYHDKRSSGSAILRSFDNGKTWQPDTSAAPYEAWRVIQIPVGTYLGRPYFTGQMPVSIELHNGVMMTAVETQYLDSACYISLAYSSDNWKTPLGLTQAGPASLKEKLWGGVAPYLVQFDSGEVILSYVTVQNGLMQIRVGSPDGNVMSDPYSIYDGISTGLWSAVEVLDDHTLGVVCDFQPTLSSGETLSFLSVSRARLNHSFDATKGQSITVDGDNSDWRCGVDALFLGSESQAQSSLRISEDGEYVYFLIDRLDEYLNKKDGHQLFISADKDVYYKIELSTDGVSEISKFENGKFTTISVDGVKFGSFVGGTYSSDKDKDDGYVLELAIPKSALGLGGSTMYVTMAMTNRDGKENYDKDEFELVKITDRDTWTKVSIN